MPHSHHSHSGQFCAHGSGSLESVIQEAIKQKYITYGLTEHVPRYHLHELYPEEIEAHLGPEQLAAQFDAFIEEAHRLKELYADRICLLIGAETELIDLNEDVRHLQALLQKHGSKIEYLVGSIHHVNGIPIDFDRATYEKAVSSVSLPSSSVNDEKIQLESFFKAYFEAQYRLMTSLTPSLGNRPYVIGHIDLCRLYTPDIVITSYPLIRQLLVRNVRFAVEHGMLFEANAAAFRKGWVTSYPGKDVLDVILSNGGRLVLSDDAHSASAVGGNYHKLREYLREAGVTDLYHLARWAADTNSPAEDEPVVSTPAPLRVVKYHGQWWDDSFWDGQS